MKKKVNENFNELLILSKFYPESINLGIIPKINLIDHETINIKNKTVIFDYDFYIETGKLKINIQHENNIFNKQLEFTEFDYKKIKKAFDEELLVFNETDYELLEDRINKINKNIKLDIKVEPENLPVIILNNLNMYMIKYKDELSKEEINEIKIVLEFLKTNLGNNIPPRIKNHLEASEANLEYFKNTDILQNLSEIEKETKFKIFQEEQKTKKEWIQNLIKEIKKNKNSKIKNKELKKELRNKLKELDTDLLLDNDILEIIEILEINQPNLVPEDILKIYFGNNYLDKAEKLLDPDFGIKKNISKEELITKLLNTNLVQYDDKYFHKEQKNLLNENVKENLKNILSELIELLEKDVEKIEKTNQDTDFIEEANIFFIEAAKNKIQEYKNILKNINNINFYNIIKNIDVKKCVYETNNGYFLNKDKFLQDVINESNFYLKQIQQEKQELKN